MFLSTVFNKQCVCILICLTSPIQCFIYRAAVNIFVAVFPLNSYFSIDSFFINIFVFPEI